MCVVINAKQCKSKADFFDEAQVRWESFGGEVSEDCLGKLAWRGVTRAEMWKTCVYVARRAGVDARCVF